MKKIFNLFVLIALFVAVPTILSAQNPPHPNGGSGPGGSNTPVGGGAPVGGGLIVMMVMGAAYASKKTFQLNK